MKAKILTFILLCTALFLLLAQGAAANNVSQIDIDVQLFSDGSARIFQSWTGSFYEGTENYLPINTKDISIRDFTVKDEDTAYTFTDFWDVDASFEEKAQKCGILKTKDGVELCFGISEYGEKVYTFSYTVDGFIKAYEDFDGTNFMLINPEMSIFPSDAAVSVFLEDGAALTEENCAVWGFGFDGFTGFSGGRVYAQSASSLSGKEKMILLLRLDKGILSPAISKDVPFSELEKQAFRGSDYDYGTGFEDIIGIIICILVFGAFIFLIAFELVRRAQLKKFFKNAPYERDIPNGKNTDISDYLCKKFGLAKEKSNIIGALLLSMINKGDIEVQTQKDVGAFGKIKEKTELVPVRSPEEPYEKRLYELIICAQGADGVLQERELEAYFTKHPEKIERFINDVYNSGEKAFIRGGGFAGLPGNRLKSLSKLGKEELSSLAGFKKYLEDFSLISEKSVFEGALWEEYMVYAVLFGIADKVREQLAKVYPDEIPKIDAYMGNVIIANSYCRTMYMSSYRALQQQRSSGAGGRTSFGGGGGFSGGGVGGGSR